MSEKRFNKGAEVLMAHARKLARELEHSAVTAAHIVAVMITQNHGLGSKLLQGYNIKSKRLNQTLDTVLRKLKQDSEGESDSLSLADELKTTIPEELSRIKPRGEIGRTLLLQAILSKTNYAHTLLLRLDMDPEKLRTELRQAISKQEAA